MNRIYLLVLFSMMLTSLSAQVSDMVSLDAGYAQQSFYSLANGEVANVSNTDWDIAFSTDPFGSSILINDNIGTQLYLVPQGTSWSDVDTTGIASWINLRNSDESWLKGAFVRPADPAQPFDYGWGTYDPVSHIVTGDKVYVIELSNGLLKKVQIESLNFGTYTFKFANLDGSNEVSEAVNSASYSEKNFWYYSIQNEEVLDREPTSDSWDVSFTRYIEELPFIGNYLVTGALTNLDVTSSEVRSVETSSAAWDAPSATDDISQLGSDWKLFDMSIFEYVIEDSLTYFIQDQNSQVWKVIFTGFGGSATGNIEFTKESVVVGLSEGQQSIAFEMYPNPSNGQINIVFPIENERATIQVLDLSGRQILMSGLDNGLQHSVDLSGNSAGVYIIRLQVDGLQTQQTIILH